MPVAPIQHTSISSPSIGGAEGWRVVLTLLILAVCAPAVRASAQQPPTVLIVSQPAEGVEQKDFVDIGPYVARELQTSGRYTPLVFKPSLQQIRDALAAKTLAESDISLPIGKDASRKIARAVAATYVLRVSAELTRNGVGGTAEMERLVGQADAAPIFLQQFSPVHGRSKTPSVLAGINVMVSSIMEKITGSAGRIQVGPTVTVQIPDNRKRRSRFDKTASQKTTDSNAAEHAKSGEPGTDAANVPLPAGKTPDTASAIKTAPTSTPTSHAEAPPPSRRPEPAGPALSTLDFRVKEFRKRGDLPNLIIGLRHLIDERPRDPALRRDLARAYLEYGWQPSAQDEAARAVSIAPDAAPLHRLLGDCYAAAGNTNAAVAQYDEAIRLAPKDADNFIALGDGYWNAGRPDEALKAYEGAVRADMNSAAAHRRLARFYALKGLYADSLREMSSAGPAGTADDWAALSDFGDLLGVASSSLKDVLVGQRAIRQALVNGSKTREQAFKETTDLKRRAEAIAEYLDALPPPPSLLRVQSLYAQAAVLAVQASDAALDFLQTQDSRHEDDANLAEVETNKQLTDAARRLKAAISPKPGEGE